MKKKDPLSGFLIPADAIVPCKVCGVAEGVPCKRVVRDKEPLKPGYVHFGRRLRRLLLTGSATQAKREKFEREMVAMLREYLKGWN